MKSFFKLCVMLKRYLPFLVLAVLMSSLVAALQGVTFLSILPFWSKIMEGDPFVPEISVPLPPQILTMIANFATRINNTPNQRLMFYILAFVIVAGILRSIFMFLNDVTLQFIGNSVVRNARYRMYSHLQNLSVDYYTGQRTGEILSRITYDAEQLHQGVSDGFIRLFRSFFDLVVFIALPVLIHWKMAVIIFGIFLVVMPPIVIIGNIIRKLTIHSQEKIADLSSMLEETISGIRVVKAFSMEEYEKKRFNRHNNRFYKLAMSVARRDALISPVTEIVVMVATSIVFVVMVKAVISGQMASATFLLYLICLGSIPRPIKQIGKANNKIQRSVAAAERINKIMEMKSTVVEKEDAVVIPPMRYSLRFIHVGFSYNSGEVILKDINLTARRGDVVAIVGSSGAGKSTLVNLITRFYDVTEGKIEIDGVDIRDVTLKSLRHQIGIVTQEIILFNDTVAGNIAYGQQHTTREKIVAAARTANAYDFISALPHGFDTVVGEKGYTLSGGERQRLAIARAILKDPPILILDEATSALDSESEQLVQEAINRLMKNRTAFVIAHRLSTIRNATRILVLKDRGIAQEGRHDDLLEEGGPYKKLYEMQFRV